MGKKMIILICTYLLETRQEEKKTTKDEEATYNTSKT